MSTIRNNITLFRKYENSANQGFCLLHTANTVQNSEISHVIMTMQNFTKITKGHSSPLRHEVPSTSIKQTLHGCFSRQKSQSCLVRVER